MDKESVLDVQTIEEIKKSLLQEKQQLLADLKDVSRSDNHESDNTSAKFPEYGDKPDENAQEITDYSTNIVTEKVLEKSLEDVNKALDRIEKGTYGTCKYCGLEINPKRLMARPTASACIDCKTKLQEDND